LANDTHASGVCWLKATAVCQQLCQHGRGVAAVRAAGAHEAACWCACCGWGCCTDVATCCCHEALQGCNPLLCEVGSQLALCQGAGSIQLCWQLADCVCLGGQQAHELVALLVCGIAAAQRVEGIDGLVGLLRLLLLLLGLGLCMQLLELLLLAQQGLCLSLGLLLLLGLCSLQLLAAEEVLCLSLGLGLCKVAQLSSVGLLLLLLLQLLLLLLQ
jgi:hypothetical protein